MKRSINSLLGYTIKGTDGEIGKVEEFYFDDRTSTIRYMVVKTGGWFSGKKVLISPEAFQKPEWESKIFSVNLKQEKIKNSPDIDTDKPVSQQQEELMRGYYSWPGYYGYGMYGYWGLGMWGYPAIEESAEEKEMNQMKATEHANDNPHLRSTHEVTGYDIHATDGDIGEVDDFIIDDVTWKIHFLVVETGNWFSGKKVLISPDRIKEIDWETGAVIINTTIEQVKSSPEYDASKHLTPEYEANLQNYYGRFITHK
ncbi:MAG: PRC-barrel domain-containing protein [Bacteroidota bacterium]|nr:PRC-barrel domain-containing protein [Bacteroidota bacterium]